MENQNQEQNNQERSMLEELFGDSFADGLDFLNDPPAPAQPAAEEPAQEPEAPRPRAERKRQPARREKKEQQKNSWQKSVLLYLHDFAYFLAAIIVIFLLLFRVVVVSGTSMNNTLLDGDYLLLLGDVFYREPKQGDIVVASKSSFDDGAPIVKRVIATEGQLVSIDFEKGIVYVDGVALEEPYTLTPTTHQEGTQFPLMVKEGCVFVMGDNRNGSKDSRDPAIGLIDKREILGKVVFLFLPGTNRNQVQRDFGRIGAVS